MDYESQSNLKYQVFVSYAHEDKQIAMRIVKDLQSEGFIVWVDKEGLEPGTPNWERSIEEAISHSFAIVWVTTPNSRKSDWVGEELRIARNQEISIYPVFVAGNKWDDAVRFGKGAMQHVDCRGGAYNEGIQKIINLLKSDREHIVPKHRLIKEENVKPLPSFLSIKTPAGKVIWMRPSGYEDFYGFLRDLYEYIKEVPPYTYGLNWVLVKEPKRFEPSQIAVTWDWLNLFPKNQSLSQNNRNWSRNLDLSAFGIFEGTTWRIIEPLNDPKFWEHILAIATNDESLGGLREDEKAMYRLLYNQSEYQEVEFKVLNPNDYKFLQVFRLHGQVTKRIIAQGK